LTADERLSLDRDGYVVLPNAIENVAELREQFEKTGTRHAEWRTGNPACPKVLEAVSHILQRPFHIFVANGRDPLPGFGQQGLHTDWVMHRPGDQYAVVTTLWLLDDFTQTNGATRVIPGSHRWPRPLPKPMQQPLATHPDQKIITARAGSVLVFNGHLWHSGTKNAAAGPRRVLQIQFAADDAVRRVPDDQTGSSPNARSAS
jgi:ectoine hydroxylase-related dioxygenase (phytanoyl-CoA dioxygenase family)